MLEILSADFDQDGREDLAILSQDGTVHVLRGDGAGAFAQASTPGVPLGPQDLLAADLNSDSFPDLVTADFFNNRISILLGAGDGTFTRSSRSVGSGPSAVVAADFDGDGIVDIATANTGADTVSVLLGGGDGTFALASSPDVSDAPRDIAAGDFDGDGVIDLAVVGFVLGGGTLTVLIGAGDGTFVPEAAVSVPIRPTTVRAADVNGDGVVDLIVGGETESFRILVGQGDGTFGVAPGAVPAVPVNPSDIAVRDLNGDGNLDLVLSHGLPNSLSVLHGVGDGRFTLEQTLDPGGLSAPSPFTGRGLFPVGVAIADVDGDGILDLVSGNGGSGGISVFLGE